MKNQFFRFSLLGILLLVCVPVAFSKCGTLAHTITNTEVYDSTPVFLSGSGWRLGNVIKNLPPNTEVWICEEATVGLFFDKKKWYRIEFGANQSGWVFEGQLQLSGIESNDLNTARFSLISAAQADDADMLPSAATPGFSQGMMLFGAFVCVILGMIGKVLYDEVDSDQRLSFRSCFRKCIKPLIVAPMTFGTFLLAGNYSFSNEIAVLIFFCMAFQNGFFWQTILPANKSTPKNNRAIKVNRLCVKQI